MGFLCLPPLNETRRNECACHLNIWKVIGDKHPEKETLKNCVVSRPLNTRNFNMIIQLKIIFHKLCIVVSFRNFRNRMGGVIIPLNIEKNHWIIQGEQQRLVFFFLLMMSTWLRFGFYFFRTQFISSITSTSKIRAIKGIDSEARHCTSPHYFISKE